MASGGIIYCSERLKMGAGDGGLTKLPVPQFAVVGLWDMLA
jgi:hypothetical protein